MRAVAWLLILIRCFLIQAGSVVQAPDCLEAGERSRLEKEAKLDNRIKIYEEASNRCQQLVTDMVQRQDFQLIPGYLQSWKTLLDKSLGDIEASPGRKDKSRALRKFEIHLRKAISSAQELKLKATVDQFDAFETWLRRAEQVHKKFVDFLFER
jgi:hypothetical protein